MKQYYQWHRRLGWIVGFVVMLWSASGFLHPLMSFLSVKPVAFQPPASSLSLTAVQSPAAVLSAMEVEALRLTTLNGTTRWQVTQTSEKPNRYFDVQKGDELTDADREYAIDLARYYSGNQAAVKSAQFQTTFSVNYPPINRLLPVWQVQFDTPDKLTVYVHTGSDQLAAMINQTREILLWVFQHVHTLHFLKPLPIARTAVMTVLMSLTLGMVVLGIMLLVKKRASSAKGARFWHRALAWVIVLPLTCFVGSGVFHLWIKQLTSNEPITTQRINTNQLTRWPTLTAEYTSAKLWVHNTQQAYWRVSQKMNQPEHQHHQGSHADHGATASSELITYYDAYSGSKLPITDEQMAVTWLQQHKTIEPTNRAEVITHFTPEYGFANKWLPVWKVTDAATSPLYFVSTKVGLLSASINPIHITEQWSFNTLHKWHFLDGLGRVMRDVLLSVCALLIFISASLGVVMLIKGKRKRAV